MIEDDQCLPEDEVQNIAQQLVRYGIALPFSFQDVTLLDSSSVPQSHQYVCAIFLLVCGKEVKKARFVCAIFPLPTERFIICTATASYTET